MLAGPRGASSACHGCESSVLHCYAVLPGRRELLRGLQGSFGLFCCWSHESKEVRCVIARVVVLSLSLVPHTTRLSASTSMSHNSLCKTPHHRVTDLGKESDAYQRGRNACPKALPRVSLPEGTCTGSRPHFIAIFQSAPFQKVPLSFVLPEREGAGYLGLCLHI